MASTMLNEMEVAEIQRFGPRREASIEIPAESREKIYSESREALKNGGFKNIEENEYWYGFKSEGSEFATEAWEELTDDERTVLETNSNVPEKLLDTYKLCFDVPPEKLPALIELLGTQFGNIPMYGKIAKSNILDHENFPNLVLYLRGSHTNEVLDFAISVAKGVKSKLGENHAHLAMAKEIEKDSGVFLTQGNYSVKQEAVAAGKLTDIYGKDGALFKATDEKYDTYIKRRSNQFVIEETLYNYAGINKISDRLVALQQRAFEGVPTERTCGIREINVKVGDYLAPKAEDLPEVLEKIDEKVKALTNNPRFGGDYKYAVRASALAYTLGILAHPLEDGNGQSCTNLVTSLLYEGGHQRIYLGAFLDGRKLRSTALSQIEVAERPTDEYMRLSTKIVAKKGIRTQNEALEIEARNQEREKFAYARTFLLTALTGAGWDAINKYVETGELPSFGSSLDQTAVKSILSRVDEVNDFLQRSLQEEPTGSKNLTFEELQMAEDKFSELTIANKRAEQPRQVSKGMLASPA